MENKETYLRPTVKVVETKLNRLLLTSNTSNATLGGYEYVGDGWSDE